MKKLFTLVLFLQNIFIFSQGYEKNWQEVYQLELNGQTKSALELVKNIYEKASNKNDEQEIIKCFFYQSKFELQVNEDAQNEILKNLDLEIKKSISFNKNFFYFIKASILLNYKNYNSYKLSQRSSSSNKNSNNFHTWDLKEFDSQIEENFTLIFKNINELDKQNLLEWKETIEIPSSFDGKNISMYDFFHKKYLEYLTNDLNYFKRLNDYELENIAPKLLEQPNSFVKNNFNSIKNHRLQKIIIAIQEYEKFNLNKNENKIDESYYNRLKQFEFLNSQSDSLLSILERKTKNQQLIQQLKFDRVNKLISLASEKKDGLYQKKALKLIDSILQNRVNPKVLSDAEMIKFNLLNKSLQIETLSEIYSNQNNRAFVIYKNVDSITVSYYKLPLKLSKTINEHYNSIFNDSLVISFIDKNRPIKSFLKNLPKTNDHFEHTTEILLDNLDKGNYLILFESTNDSLSKKNAFAYSQISVSDFYIIEDHNNDKDNIYVLDKKTGEPLKDVKLISKEQKLTTDINGKASLKKLNWEKDKKYDNKILIFKEKDSVYYNYNRQFTYKYYDEDEYENLEAQVQIFTDRAIYRPGQKMFYKGIIIQKNDDRKSVVPFVTVKVYIEDGENNILNEVEIQTNEFGSFHGEFDIPKNVLTGQFTIYVDEPDNYENDKKYYNSKEDEHKFWDNVEYNDWDSRIYFQVEEYKRPTFEVTFNEIKENYTIGDTIKVKGNVKALAGNNITNAKIKYYISKSIMTKGKHFPYQENFITNEIFSDENGNFTIIFPATQENISNDSINSFNFNVKTDVTDTNGETRSANKYVIVEKDMLKLYLNCEHILYKEKNLEAEIVATTLNDYPLNTNVNVEIYKITQKHFKKSRTFSYPEINSISEDKFYELFPNEPYNEDDLNQTSELIKKTELNTENSTNLDLSFLKNYETGNYKIIILANDVKGNKFKYEKKISLESKLMPSLTTNIFGYKNISKPNSDFIEIELFSDIPELWITTRFSEDNSQNFTIQVDKLINGKKTIRFKKSKNSLETNFFHFSTVWENRVYYQNLRISREEIEKKLNIEIESFRSKIEPGSNENWSFKIVDSKLETEFLASMYDSSLDLFKTANWEKVFFYSNRINPNFPNLDFYPNKEKAYFHNFVNFKRKHFAKDYYKVLDLNTFGFNFNNHKYFSERYLESIRNQAEVPTGAKTVTGIVSDDLGPVAGANIVVKGTTRGTTTDFDGNFAISVLPGEILEISYVGYNNNQVLVDENTFYNLNLSPTPLEEVVVTAALGIKKSEKLITYAAQTNESFYIKGESEIVNALSGKISGVQVVSAKGVVGSSTKIVLRGTSSIEKNKDILYVIDGIIYENEEQSSINIDEIESVLILKDSQATALYGLRGANGVIIITTKKSLNELTQVKTRTNFNETAFFYPNLKTDKNGKIIFNFTTPESLTQWKLRLFAHNKKYETGYFETSIISQKDLMVLTNMPRFFRENDTITISAKVVNMTHEVKSGIAMLLLFNAENNQPIDTISLNTNNLKNFNCKAKESIPLSWTITLPKNISGLQYKIVAKSGNFSDGEENIIPVLSNKILLTESRPIWLKGNSNKEIIFNNLLNNKSNTLEHQKYTLEYSSNPLWIVLQSLPYLLEYEHECAEQTFARYYANFIASEIIDSNEKIKSVLETWKNNKSVSKFNLNEDLKTIILNETPWLLDAESDEEKNKRLALLLDLKTLKDSQENTFEKLIDKQNANGSFSWFTGGNDNIYITQHILAGFGHLSKMFPNKKDKFQQITNKTISFLDQTIIAQNNINLKHANNYLNLHYWYARSFYLEEFPLSQNLKVIFDKQIENFKKDWLSYSLYQKGLTAITLHRMGEIEWSNKIITHLKETVSTNDEKGMYWLENNQGYYWYQSPIETQAILIEAFDEIEKDKKYIEELKAWLLFKKQTNHWPTTKSTSEAVYALLQKGKDWTTAKENVKFTIGNSKINSEKILNNEKQNETGYSKINWNKDEISNDMGKISINNKSEVPVFGGIYWQYFENLENIKSDSTSVINIDKKLFKKVKTSEGYKLLEISNENIKIGDLITIKLTISIKENLEFVHLKDSRASCFEPIDVISKYQYKDGASFYKSTRDTATHFFFDDLKKGSYIFEYDVRTTNSGSFTDGIATIQSMYAPEFNSHSSATKISIE